MSASNFKTRNGTIMGQQVNDCTLSEPISHFSTCVPANYVSFVARKFVLSGHAGVRDDYDVRKGEGDEEEESSDPRNGTSISLNEFNTRGSRLDGTINDFPGKLEQRKDDGHPITHVGHSANSCPPPRVISLFSRRLRERCQRDRREKERKKERRR